jgi:hypothetical protein
MQVSRNAFLRYGMRIGLVLLCTITVAEEASSIARRTVHTSFRRGPNLRFL